MSMMMMMVMVLDRNKRFPPDPTQYPIILSVPSTPSSTADERRRLRR
jgi:hypothetical protein